MPSIDTYIIFQCPSHTCAGSVPCSTWNIHEYPQFQFSGSLDDPLSCSQWLNSTFWLLDAYNILQSSYNYWYSQAEFQACELLLVQIVLRCHCLMRLRELDLENLRGCSRDRRINSLKLDVEESRPFSIWSRPSCLLTLVRSVPCLRSCALSVHLHRHDVPVARKDLKAELMRTTFV